MNIKDLIIKKRNLSDIQKELVNSGELINEEIVVTETENRLGNALIINNIKIIPQFIINGISFDFKILNYPILIECDGGVHSLKDRRLKDYRKDRLAQSKGFKVLRFANGEINNQLNKCIEEIKNVIDNSDKSPREVVLYPISIFELIKRWFKNA